LFFFQHISFLFMKTLISFNLLNNRLLNWFFSIGLLRYKLSLLWILYFLLWLFFWNKLWGLFLSLYWQSIRILRWILISTALSWTNWKFTQSYALLSCIERSRIQWIKLLLSSLYFFHFITQYSIDWYFSMTLELFSWKKVWIVNVLAAVYLRRWKNRKLSLILRT